MPESSVPEERVVAIRIKHNRNLRVGAPWSPEVVDFYMEMYPDMIEYGYTLEQLANMYLQEEWV